MLNVDVVVIGAGPGGYPAAIRASQLGNSVLIVDKGTIGGECLNWGCIPSKTLISSANFYHKLKHKAKIMGIHADNIRIDIKIMMAWKESIQNTLIEGIKQLLKSNKVKLIFGNASFINKNEIKIINEGTQQNVKFKYAIIATGASFISIPGFEIDEKDILSAKGLLSVSEIPDELICIGGGVIGLELGTVFAKLGSKVKIVELLPQLMTGVSKRLVQVVKKNLVKMGVEIFLECKGTKLEKKNGKLYLTLDGKNTNVITADKILLSIGKRANTDDLGLNNIGIKTDDKGFIKTDNKQKTNIEQIFAVGDCTGLPFLAHRATKQGIIAAEVISGKDSSFNFISIPSVIFTDPEIAIVGLSEKEAKDKGIEVIVGRASFAASGKALSQLNADGFVRVITEDSSGKILGIEIVGPHASELISEAALALELGLTSEQLGYTIHPHPTLPEMLMEAAESTIGKAIHVPNARRKKRK